MICPRQAGVEVAGVTLFLQRLHRLQLHEPFIRADRQLDPVRGVVDVQRRAGVGVTSVAGGFVLLHNDRGFACRSALSEGAHEENEEGNLLCHIPIRKGDVEKGFTKADVIIEGEYYTPFVEHAYLEPEAGLAVPEEGGVTVYVGSQSSIHDQEDIAAALGLPLEKVRVVHTPMGGAFGGKEDITVQIVAALGAWKTGRPVKFVWTRQESLLASIKRHAEWMRYRTGATRDGKLVAAEIEIYGDGGAYASATDAVLFRSASFACGPYEVPNVKVDAYGVITNNPPCGAMRGFGNPQPTFASEIQMDRLAEALGMDPVKFRLKNILEPGKTTITGHVLQHSVGARSTLEAVRDSLAESGMPEPPPGNEILARLDPLARLIIVVSFVPSLARMTTCSSNFPSASLSLLRPTCPLTDTPSCSSTAPNTEPKNTPGSSAVVRPV